MYFANLWGMKYLLNFAVNILSKLSNFITFYNNHK